MQNCSSLFAALVTVHGIHPACIKLTSTERQTKKRIQQRQWWFTSTLWISTKSAFLKENYYSVGGRRNQHHTLQNDLPLHIQSDLSCYKGGQKNPTVTETKASFSILFLFQICFSIQLDASTNIFKTLNIWLVNPLFYHVIS